MEVLAIIIQQITDKAISVFDTAQMFFIVLYIYHRKILEKQDQLNTIVIVKIIIIDTHILFCNYLDWHNPHVVQKP